MRLLFEHKWCQGCHVRKQCRECNGKLCFHEHNAETITSTTHSARTGCSLTQLEQRLARSFGWIRERPICARRPMCTHTQASWVTSILWSQRVCEPLRPLIISRIRALLRQDGPSNNQAGFESGLHRKLASVIENTFPLNVHRASYWAQSSIVFPTKLETFVSTILNWNELHSHPCKHTFT